MRLKHLIWTLAFVAFLVSATFIVRTLEVEALRTAVQTAVSSPLAVAGVLALYASAFILRAALWRQTLPGLPLGNALASIHVSLAANHLLPLRLGEAVRVTDLVRRTKVKLSSATASTVLLRSADVIAVIGLATMLSPRMTSGMLGSLGLAIAAAGACTWLIAVIWMRRSELGRRWGVEAPPFKIIAVALLAWILESAVMWQAARWAGLQIGVLDAVLITAVTIAAQTLALAPGGIGTYEAAATAAFLALGFDAAPALAAAVVAHALKTAYALLAGAMAAFTPAPGSFGRLRIQRMHRESEGKLPQDGPIVLFLPAHNEEETIGAVLGRFPKAVLGREVRRMVIDDGSTDRTAERARLAGATVISFSGNQGLGAAVRRGLEEGVSLGACAIAFCDADGEYAPEELATMVQPILDGDADLVSGSRFAGTIETMHLHRRFGNRVLTALLRVVAREKITDGQSGYRAFSGAAAAESELVHDFNYAQVLTLDLLAKGFRYAEVPITYSFRESGRSFVRLGRYLRNVVPAVYREINGEAFEHDGRPARRSLIAP